MGMGARRDGGRQQLHRGRRRAPRGRRSAADAPVQRVIIADGRAAGVELEDGTVTRSRRVISSAHPIDHIPGPDRRGGPAPTRSSATSSDTATRSGSVKVNIGLAGLPETDRMGGRPVPGDPTPASWRSRPRSSTSSGHGTTRSTGGCPPSPYIEAVFPTVFEPGIAPEGKHVALCFTQFGPFERRRGAGTTSAKRTVADRVDTLDEYCPGLADVGRAHRGPGSARHRGAVRVARRQHLPGRDDARTRCSRSARSPGTATHRTPIDGLYLCGAGTHPGGGVMGFRAGTRGGRRRGRDASSPERSSASHLPPP